MVSYKVFSTIASFNAWNQVHLEFSDKFLGTLLGSHIST